MKSTGKKKSVLILFLTLLLLQIQVPVYAATLYGDMEGEALGQTTVTARVEASQESDDSKMDGEEISTGDKTKGLIYICIVLSSGMVITGILWKKKNDEDKRREQKGSR